MRQIVNGKKFSMDNQFCYNEGSYRIFVCSNCKAVIIGVMIDDFDYAIKYPRVASYCSNCGARIIRKEFDLIKKI